MVGRNLDRTKVQSSRRVRHGIGDQGSGRSGERQAGKDGKLGLDIESEGN